MWFKFRASYLGLILILTRGLLFTTYFYIHLSTVTVLFTVIGIALGLNTEDPIINSLIVEFEKSPKVIFV